MRTREELQLPFLSERSPVREAGLSLASLEIKTFDCPHTKLRQETGDVKMAAKSFTEEIRAWSNFSFLSGLFIFCLYLKWLFRVERTAGTLALAIFLAQLRALYSISLPSYAVGDALENMRRCRATWSCFERFLFQLTTEVYESYGKKLKHTQIEQNPSKKL